MSSHIALVCVYIYILAENRIMFYLFSLANAWKLKSGITINLAVMTGYTQAQLHFQHTSEKFSTTTRHTVIFNGEYVTLTVSVQVINATRVIWFLTA